MNFAEGLGFPDWRDGTAYRRLADIDRTGLMWEWLRRDPAYIAAYACAGAQENADAAEAARWGLHFC